MAVPTVNVTVNIFDQAGLPLQNASVVAQLVGLDTYNGQFVDQIKQTVLTDANGTAVLPLFPNSLGARNSFYRFTVTRADGHKILDTIAVVPNVDCNLQAIAGSVAQPYIAEKFQPFSDGLSALASLVGAPDTVPYFTGIAAMASTALTAFGRSLIAASSAAAAIGILGLSLGSMASQNANAVAITGGTISIPTLTAATSVVTPLLSAPGVASTLLIEFPGYADTWKFVGNIASPSAGFFGPNIDNLLSFGDPTLRIKQVFTPAIDSGTTGSLSLKTNGGQVHLNAGIVSAAVVNFLEISGHSTGNPPFLRANGADTDIALSVFTKAAGTLSLGTGGPSSNTVQLGILHTAGATNNITVTGSNGGNPKIGVTAGSLAITPAVVMASTLTKADALLNRTTTAHTNNAGAQTATITNGPTAGNPTKWIPIDDNGTTRNIPAW